jgi:thiamine biosynthesis protein ThiS
MKMEIKVTLERENSTKKINFRGKKVEELLHQLKLNPEAVIVTRNDEILTEEDSLKNKDHLTLLSVVSGG